MFHRCSQIILISSSFEKLHPPGATVSGSVKKILESRSTVWSRTQWRIHGGKSGHGPPNWSWQWSLPYPSGAERVMIGLWICRKVRLLAPPRIDVGYGFVPLRKMAYITTLKRSMTKKRSSEIWGDRWTFFIFWGKCRRNFSRETPKKVVQKFRQKFAPPVSEVLDPLVHALTLHDSGRI